MNVLIQNRQKEKVRLKHLNALARLALKNSGYDNAELSILLTENNNIQELNKRYLKKDKPTDVLSFPMYEKHGKKGVKGGRWKNISPYPPFRIAHPVILGDVVISVETAKMQAKERGITVGEEMARLLVHGILHLIGFDHEKGGREALRMEKEEERLLEIAKCKLQNAKWSL